MKDRAKIKELTNRVDEVLYYLWDPIGVSDEPCARGEYSTYVGSIVSLLNENKEDKIAKRLSEIETTSMGLTKNDTKNKFCLLYTSPSPRDRQKSRMPSSA